MQFDTKIAVVIRTDLEPWQKLNVASFLAGGIAAAFPECIGEPYEDGSGTKYLSLIGQPILIYGATGRRCPARSNGHWRATSRRRSIPRTCSRPRMTPPTARWSGRDPRRLNLVGPRDARRAQGDRQDRRRTEVSQLGRTAKFRRRQADVPLTRTSDARCYRLRAAQGLACSHAFRMRDAPKDRN